MKCNNCGFENGYGVENCVNCGAVMQKDEVPYENISLNPASDVVLPALQDKLFHVLCILMTVTAGISVLMGSIDVISILITIFLWLVYNDAKNKGVANASHLQFISGTVYANYVITNVASIILMVVGPLFAYFYTEAFKENPKEILKFLEEFFKELGIAWAEISSETIEYFGVAFGATLFVMGVIMLIFNLLCMRKIHRFAKSVYMGLMYQDTNFYKPTTVKNWLIFLAVCNGISAFNMLPYGIFALLPTAVSTATLIVVIMLLGKYFPKYR